MANCSNCGYSNPAGNANCIKCGSALPVAQESIQPAVSNSATVPQPVPQSPHGQPQAQPMAAANKSRLAYVLLGVFLGYLGIHNFYAGRTGIGIAQLLISVLTCAYGIPITFIWAIIEVIAITKDGDGNPFTS